MTEQHDLSVTRLIDAPRDIVWRAWVERKEDWFCPKPWRATIVEEDLRPGGRSALVMYGPDGEENAMEGVVLEAIPGERVVTTDAFSAGWVPQAPFMVAITTFADEDGKTRYTATARHWDAEARDRHEAMGFHQGWGQVADQLAEIAEAMKADA